MAEGELNPGERFSWSDVRHTAQQRFHVSRFRPGQRELISAALQGRDALGILPTGAGNLVRRSGKSLRLRRPFEPDELEAFAATFEARYDADRERIASMMRYGQTTRCRMQFLREYFGDEPGEACCHCDNCSASGSAAGAVA